MDTIWIAEINDHEVIGLYRSQDGAMCAVELRLVEEKAAPEFADDPRRTWREIANTRTVECSYSTRNGRPRAGYVYPMHVQG